MNNDTQRKSDSDIGQQKVKSGLNTLKSKIADDPTISIYKRDFERKPRPQIRHEGRSME